MRRTHQPFTSLVSSKFGKSPRAKMSAVCHPELCIICQCPPDGDVVGLQCRHVFHKECIAPCFQSKAPTCPVVEIFEDGRTCDHPVNRQTENSPLCRTRIQEYQTKHYSGHVFQKSHITAREWEPIPESQWSKILKKNKKRMERRLKKEGMNSGTQGGSSSGAGPSAYIYLSNRIFRSARFYSSYILHF